MCKPLKVSIYFDIIGYAYFHFVNSLCACDVIQCPIFTSKLSQARRSPAFTPPFCRLHFLLRVRFSHSIIHPPILPPLLPPPLPRRFFIRPPYLLSIKSIPRPSNIIISRSNNSFRRNIIKTTFWYRLRIFLPPLRWRSTNGNCS